MNILSSVNSKVMSSMAELAASINESSVALSAGEGVTGILVKETQPEDVQEVSFAYISPNDSISVGELLLSDLHMCAVSVT